MTRAAWVALVAAAGLGCLGEYRVETQQQAASATGAGAAASTSSATGTGGGGGHVTPPRCNGDPVGPLVEEVLSDAPLGYWRLDAVDGNTTFGAGPGMPGGFVDGVAIVGEGQLSGMGAARFDTIQDGSVGIDWTALDSLLAVDTTVELWVKPTKDDWIEGTDWPFVFQKSNSGLRTGLELVMHQQRSYASLWHEQDHVLFANTHDVTAPRNEWTHVVITFAPAEQRLALFLDGEAVAVSAECEAGICPDFSNGGLLAIGGSTGAGSSYDGFIDEVAVYDHILSDDRICVHHRAGREKP